MDSSRGIINYNKDRIYALDSKLQPKKGEMSESLEYIMTDGDRSLIDNIFKIKEDTKLKELFDIKYFLEETNENLIKELKNIENCVKEISVEKNGNCNSGENPNQIKNETNKKKILDADKRNAPFEEKKNYYNRTDEELRSEEMNEAKNDK